MSMEHCLPDTNPKPTLVITKCMPECRLLLKVALPAEDYKGPRMCQSWVPKNPVFQSTMYPNLKGLSQPMALLISRAHQQH
ncbi:hypothetical protein PtB15_9B620 [Puccinia triticina]|nr:hypothetical protein PtB15_9B620 [Puccinia triticina]